MFLCNKLVWCTAEAVFGRLLLYKRKLVSKDDLFFFFYNTFKGNVILAWSSTLASADFFLAILLSNVY